MTTQELDTKKEVVGVIKRVRSVITSNGHTVSDRIT